MSFIFEPKIIMHNDFLRYLTKKGSYRATELISLSKLQNDRYPRILFLTGGHEMCLSLPKEVHERLRSSRSVCMHVTHISYTDFNANPNPNPNPNPNHPKILVFVICRSACLTHEWDTMVAC